MSEWMNVAVVHAADLVLHPVPAGFARSSPRRNSSNGASTRPCGSSSPSSRSSATSWRSWPPCSTAGRWPSQQLFGWNLWFAIIVLGDRRRRLGDLRRTVLGGLDRPVHGRRHGRRRRRRDHPRPLRPGRRDGSLVDGVRIMIERNQANSGLWAEAVATQRPQPRPAPTATTACPSSSRRATRSCPGRPCSSASSRSASGTTCSTSS